MEIKRKLSTNHCYANKNKPKYITIHETDNYDKGASASKNALAQYNGNLGISVHYYVDSKEVWQVLDHRHGSWSIGDLGNKFYNSLYGIHNLNSISVEICVNPESDYNIAVTNTINLTKQLMKELNIPIQNVVRHYDATRKKCPKKILASNYWETFKSRLIQSNNGWVKESGNWYFYKDNKKVYGWLKDKNKWYYLANDGRMLIGWQQIKYKEKYEWFYFESNGAMVTGWIKYKGKDFYLHDNGVMENSHLDKNKKCYHFNMNGELIKEGDL